MASFFVIPDLKGVFAAREIDPETYSRTLGIVNGAIPQHLIGNPHSATLNLRPF